MIGGTFKGLISFFGALKGVLEGAILIGNRIFFFGGDISPALLAVGFIVRLNVAILIFIGGFLGTHFPLNNIEGRNKNHARSYPCPDIG